jgi:Na+-transporting NADH:ubiquinone oxidoreductase subunit C
MAHESTTKAYATTVGLAVVCSVLVSSAAVGLRPRQEANQERYIRKSILVAAGLYDPNLPVAEVFKKIETRIIDLRTGEYVPTEEVDPSEFEQIASADDGDLSVAIAADSDVAGIRRRENYSAVYLVANGQDVEQIVLPVRGKGLWSTMIGFIALDADDLNTINGITFYDHGETPGLGGEIDNPTWQGRWKGKKVYAADGAVALKVLKGAADSGSPDFDNQVDGISGATLTINGVTGLVQYWFGDDAFKPYLDRLREEKGLPL